MQCLVYIHRRDWRKSSESRQETEFLDVKWRNMTLLLHREEGETAEERNSSSSSSRVDEETSTRAAAESVTASSYCCSAYCGAAGDEQKDKERVESEEREKMKTQYGRDNNKEDFFFDTWKLHSLSVAQGLKKEVKKAWTLTFEREENVNENNEWSLLLCCCCCCCCRSGT